MPLLEFLFGRKKPSAPAPEQRSLAPAQAPSPTFAWTSSEAHRLLLSRFLYPQVPATAAPPHWDGPLGEPARSAIDRFVALGLAIPVTPASWLQTRVNTKTLKERLKERGLRVSGARAELEQRLLSADPAWVSAQAAHSGLLECSSQGRQIAEQYLAEHRAEQDALISATNAQVRAGQYASASAAVASYNARQVFPPGLNIDWTRHDTASDVAALTRIFSARPSILRALPDAEWEPLRVAAGMMQLWGQNKKRAWLPDDFVGPPGMDPDVAVRMLFFDACHQRDLAGFRHAQFRRVKVHASPDSCEECQRIAGKSMPIDQVIELPHPGCTHAMGCRCFYSPER